MSAEKPDFAAAGKAAAGLLRDFGIARPPVNPVQIARALGVDVYFAEFSENMQSVSGFYDAEDDAIIVNSEEFALRQTFTVAHELGHRVLHREWAKTAEYKVLLRDQAEKSKDKREIEANFFASRLLVPRFMLDQYWRLISKEDLSKLFAVSIPVIENRLKSEYGY